MPERLARLPVWLALTLFGGGLAAAAWRIPAPPPAELAPAPVVSASAGELPGAVRTSPQRSSLTRLPDGRLAAAWLDDGEADTAAIRLAIRDHQGWREVGRIATRESTAAAAFMHARSLGRPILWAEGGWLHLWYEAYPLSPGAGASLLHSVSTDGGRSWQQTRRLGAGPFGGLGARLGETPRPLADGGVLLPLALHGKEGHWLQLAATGQLIGLLRQLPAAGQPAVSAP